MKKSVVWLFIALAVFLLAVASVGCKAQDEITPVPTAAPEQPDVIVNNELPPAEHIIEVTGYGEVIAAPDVSTITLGIQGAAETAEEATLVCDALVQTVRDVTLSQELPSQNVTRAGVTLNTNQRESDGAILGYVASDTITIVTANVGRVNTLLSAIIDAGVTERYEVSYSLTDSSAAYQSALAAAMTDAQQKAASIAASAGATLGGVVGVVETPGEDYKLVGVAFESSAIAVSAQVTVRYLIP